MIGGLQHFARLLLKLQVGSGLAAMNCERICISGLDYIPITMCFSFFRFFWFWFWFCLLLVSANHKWNKTNKAISFVSTLKHARCIMKGKGP